MIVQAIPAETLQQAQADGATHFSALYEEFYRRNRDGNLEHSRLWDDGSLGPWVGDWRVTPPESAVRL